MENFVLYHEIYKRDGMTMYKGRKKGTITYVAVSCIDKNQRIKVTNHVRIVFELENRHIVKFYEWYETSNHLWLVTDLCVGGSLHQMLTEDGSWPESSVRYFGEHLVRGLHYIHSCGLIFIHWTPVKIVLDGEGILKYFDFSDSRKAEEDYEELVQRFFGGLNIELKDVEELFDCHQATPYTAPEIISGSQPGFATDLWGLGCIFYEMFTGTAPFSGRDENEMIQNIVNNPLLIPKMQGSRMCGRASADFSDLLEKLLNKRPESRMTIGELCRHPFWQGSLLDLAQQSKAISAFMTPQEKVVRPKTVSDDQDGSSSTVDDISFTLHLGSRAAVEPTSSVAAGNEQSTTSRNNSTKRNNKFQLEPQAQEKVKHQLFPDLSEPMIGDQQELLIRIASCSSVIEPSRRQIDDYSRMLKDGRLKFDSKLLSVIPLSLAKFRSSKKSDREKHLKQLESTLKVVEKGPPSQKRLHFINYLGQISMAPDVCTYLSESGVPMEICRQIKSSSNQELLVRLCQTLAIIINFGPTEHANVYEEMIVMLTDVLRDQFRCSRVKLASLIALGEVLVRHSLLSPDDDASPPVPPAAAMGLCVTLLHRCLHRSEDVATNLAAARTVEYVVQTPRCPLAILLTSADTIQQLHGAYKHASLDLLKTSSITALARLTRIDGALFCGLLEKTGGVHGFIDNLHVALLSVQEAVLEMFAIVLLGQQQSPIVRKLSTDGSFLTSIMRLLETPAVVIRAKVLLLVLLVCRTDFAQLRTATDGRLVLYLERELRRTNGMTDGAAAVMDRCLGLWTSFLASTAVPSVLVDTSAALQAVHGRRHPSGPQMKALRSALPLLEAVSMLGASPSLRRHIVTDGFCRQLGDLLTHTHGLDTGQTSGAGPDIAPQLMTAVLSLVEAACHGGTDTVAGLLTHVFVPLAVLTGGTTNADVRIIGLKLCNDAMQLLLDMDDAGSSSAAAVAVARAAEMYLLPHGAAFAAEPDPSAVYLLRILRHYVAIAGPISAASSCRQHAVPSLLVRLLHEHQQAVGGGGVVLEALLLVSTVGQTSADLLRDAIIDNGLVPVLRDICLEIGDALYRDDLSVQSAKVSELLLTAMETVSAVAKLIADLVRRALSSKKNNDDEQTTVRLTQEAEELLNAGKPFTETVDLLVYNIGWWAAAGDDDVDMVDGSVRLLNQIVSLYGGQQIQHGLSEDNLQSLCSAVIGCSVKHRRMLLRILKRLLASGHVSSEGAFIVKDMLEKIGSSGDTDTVDAPCLSLADEILRYIDK